MVASQLQPTAAVILPTYNRLQYLKEAVESVRSQSFTNWELVVIDDGSTDGSQAWIAALADARIRVIAQPHTGRIGHLRNLGIGATTAPWVTFIDSDDRWAPDKLQRQLRFHEMNPHLRWSYTGLTIIDAHGAEVQRNSTRPWQPFGGKIVRELLAMQAQIGLPGVMIARELLVQVGGFDETLILSEDYDLELRLARVADAGVLPEPLIDVRSHASTTMDHPGVPASFVVIYDRHRQITTDPVEKELCLDRIVTEGSRLAHQLIGRHKWSDAFAAIAHSFRARPFNRRALGAAVRFIVRRAAAAAGLRRPIP